MKTAVTDIMKAGLAMLAGWALAGWMLLLLIASLSMFSQA